MPGLSSSVKLDGRLVLAGGADPRTNSYRCPLGPQPGRAFVLVEKAHLDAIADAATHSLEFSSKLRGTSSTLTVAGLRLVRAEKLAGGAPAATSAYVVELADRRIVAALSDSGVVTANVRSPAHAAEYLTGTECFTWQSLLECLWSRLPPEFGACPTLPYVPVGRPENLLLYGQNAWDAIHCLLGQLVCTTAYDPTADAFSFVALGAAQPAPDGLPQRLFQGDVRDHVAVHVPETVRVWFHVDWRNRGQEPDVELDGNWLREAATSLDVPTGVAGAVPGTVLSVWDALFDVRDAANAADATRDALRTGRAAELAARLVADLSTSLEHDVYESILPQLRPGSQIKEVRYVVGAAGVRTEVVRGPGVVADRRGRLRGVNEAFFAPDLARRTTPTWPREANLVEVFEPQTPTGTAATLRAASNAGEVVSGRVRRNDGATGAMEIVHDCWIRVLDRQGADATATVGTYLGPARLSGTACVGGECRPLYVVRQAESATTTTTTSTTTAGAAAPCTGRCYWTWSAAGGWTKVSDTCATTTTTTTSTTTTTATSTTTTPGGPCVCPATTTTSTTTTTTSTTTTPAPSCGCLCPEFDGLADGDCTYTPCVSGAAVQDCATTTTSTTTTTTTCGCDCATTTTAAPLACGDCQWSWLPRFGGFQWVRTNAGCTPPCRCDAPNAAGSPCEDAVTLCTTTTTAAPPPPSCDGDCLYWWEDVTPAWVLVESDCAAEYVGCGCEPPSFAGDGCGPVRVPCSAPTTTTSTTTTGGPCACCYTTTSTTTSSTTTTTSACRAECVWEALDGGWTKAVDPCQASCPCAPPAIDPTDVCELTRTPCGTATTTTTTSTTTTTPETGACCDGGSGTCIDGALADGCNGPGDVFYGGQTCAEVPCGGSTTTTTTSTTTTTGGGTSSTTTTTTTTSTTTSTPDYSGACCDNWFGVCSDVSNAGLCPPSAGRYTFTQGTPCSGVSCTGTSTSTTS